MAAVTLSTQVLYGTTPAGAFYKEDEQVWPPLPPPFNPADITGLGLWLDASTLSLADGASVTTWTDVSGAGHHATATDTPPVYRPTVMNGNPGVVFNASPITRMLIPGWGTALSGKTEYTLFLVLNQTATMTTYPVIMVAPTNTTWTWLLEWDVSNFFYWGSGSNALRLYAVAAATNTPHLLTLHKLTAGPRLYLDQTDHTTNYALSSGVDMAVAVPDIGANVILGGYYTGTLGISGPVSEVIWYDHAITDPERLEVEGYLVEKWGL